MDQLDAVIEVRAHKGSEVLLTVRNASAYRPVTISSGDATPAGRKILRLSSSSLTMPRHRGMHPPEAAHLTIDLSIPVQTSVQATLIGLAKLHAADPLEGCLESYPTGI